MYFSLKTAVVLFELNGHLDFASCWERVFALQPSSQKRRCKENTPTQRQSIFFITFAPQRSFRIVIAA